MHEPTKQVTNIHRLLFTNSVFAFIFTHLTAASIHAIGFCFLGNTHHKHICMHEPTFTYWYHDYFIR